jgi:hypothetical protein
MASSGGTGDVLMWGVCVEKKAREGRKQNSGWRVDTSYKASRSTSKPNKKHAHTTKHKVGSLFKSQGRIRKYEVREPNRALMLRIYLF